MNEPENLVELYLQEIRDERKYPLLKAHEELELGKAIAQGKSAARCLLQDTVNGDRQKLVEAAAIGNEARLRLTSCNLRLVADIAIGYVGYHSSILLDVIEEGNFGLFRAVDKFNYRLGWKFSSYAYPWIRQKIQIAVPNLRRKIRLPRYLNDKAEQLGKIEARLLQELHRQPTVEELAEELHYPPKKTIRLFNIIHVLSLEKPVGEEQESVLGDFIPDEQLDNVFGEKLLQSDIQQAFTTLPAREARVLTLRFGLENGSDHEQKEIAEKFNVSPERIRQMKEKALERLRIEPRRQRLHDYLE